MPTVDILAVSQSYSSQSYLALLSATKDRLILLSWQNYISYIAGTMKPFLTECQYTKPMMPIIYDDLHQLSRDIVSRYNKPKTLEKCKNAIILCDINFSDAKDHLRNIEVDIGFGANKILTGKMKTDEISKRGIDLFTGDCLKFLELLTSFL